MFPLSSFRWTSRRGVCRRLFRFLDKTRGQPRSYPVSRPRRDPDRYAAASLLAELAAKEDEIHLRSLLMDFNEDGWIRTYALRGLARLRSRLPAGAVEKLLEDWAARRRAKQNDPELTQPPEEEWLYQSVEPSLEDILRSARLKTEAVVALRFLKRLPESTVRFLCREIDSSRGGLHEGVGRWLKSQAKRFADRRPSLERSVRDLSAPLAVLLARLGPARLMKRLERELMRAGEVDSWEMRRSNPAGRALFQWLKTVEPQVQSLASSGLAPLLRVLRGEMLLDRLLDGEARADARDWAREAVRSGRCTAIARRMIAAIAGWPHERDSAFFRWLIAIAQRPEFRFYAVHGLERLGEDSAAWREKLEDLARDEEAFVQMRAHAALARRGRRSSLAALRRTAVFSIDLWQRAEAVRFLGEIDAEGNRDVLTRALMKDHAVARGSFLPVVQEAAFGIAQIGGKQALTILLRAVLMAPGNVECGALEEYIRILSRRLEGKKAPLRLWPYHCRGWRFEDSPPVAS